jgi:hypothetical protein
MILNLEKDLHAVGVRDFPFTEFVPDEVQNDAVEVEVDISEE